MQLLAYCVRWLVLNFIIHRIPLAPGGQRELRILLTGLLLHVIRCCAQAGFPASGSWLSSKRLPRETVDMRVLDVSGWPRYEAVVVRPPRPITLSSTNRKVPPGLPHASSRLACCGTQLVA